MRLKFKIHTRMKSYHTMHFVHAYFVVIVCQIWSIFGQVEKAVLPEDDYALSLWLITRTGWVYCERAGVYMDAVQQRFNEVKCKKCYTDLFDKHKGQPNNVTDSEIVKCSKNFGAALIPQVPTFSTTENSSEESQQRPTASFGLFRQLNPLETMGVRAFTCNSEVSENRTLSMDQIVIPTIATVFQLFSSQQFSSDSGIKRQFPRKSYVDCLFGKLFETELALCPINASRRRCALQKRQADEEHIFSTKLLISFD